MYNAEFSFRAVNAYLTREIAAGRALNMWGRLYGSLPNPDPVLRRTGQAITVLDEIRRENHVTACAESREAAVTKKKWAIERADASPRAAEIAETVFNGLPVRRIVREICEAWGYGYQISEIIWRREGDLLLPERVLGLPRPWFSFGPTGELRLLSNNSITGEPAEPYKFLLTQHRASFDNPYGESKYSACFWPVTFKKGGLKFWAVFLEKFGMPHAIGKLSRGASDKDRNELLDAIAGLIRDASAVIPDDGSVDLVEANVTGSSDAYERFAQYHDGEISTAILGHSAAATATPGKLGGDDMALQVRADITGNDCEMVTDTLNTLIKYIHELNPSLGEARPEFLLYDEKDIDKPRAERDALLLNTGRVKLTKKYFVDKYGFADDEIEVVEPAAAMMPEFAAPPAARTDAGGFQQAVDTLADGLPDDYLQTQVEGLLSPVFDLVNNADSLDDVLRKTDGLYSAIDDGELAKGVEKAALIGEVWGKVSYQANEKGATGGKS
jgi:phage gp29-like protein